MALEFNQEDPSAFLSMNALQGVAVFVGVGVDDERIARGFIAF